MQIWNKLKFTLLVLVVSFFCSTVYGQLEGGVKIGVSDHKYANPKLSEITLYDEFKIPAYNLDVQEVRLGYHFGAFARLSVWKLFLQAEALGNSTTVDYSLEDLKQDVPNRILKEQYTNLDIPVVLGIKFDWFNVQGGVNGHLPISRVSELKTLEGYDINADDFNFSYLAGIGLDIWKLRIDIRYELSTSFFGDEIIYQGQSYRFQDADNRILAGLAYSF